MNLKEIKHSLDRLNRYFEFMNSSPDKISSLDRDSFLQQLRDIYDLVLHSEHTPIVSKEEAPIVKETPKKEEKKITKKAPKLIFNQQEPPTQEKVPVKEEPAPVEHKEEEKVEKKQEPKVEIKKEVPVEPTPPKEVKNPIVQETPEIKEEQAPIATTNGQSSSNEEYEELFIFKEATDLAAKLSESPISNLNQSLGLNEKFHYINELFAGDVATFKTAIDYFNEAENMEKARTYAEAHLIEQFGWMKKEKKNLAKDFIKFIRRRYL